MWRLRLWLAKRFTDAALALVPTGSRLGVFGEGPLLRLGPCARRDDGTYTLGPWVLTLSPPEASAFARDLAGVAARCEDEWVSAGHTEPGVRAR